jgi:hypothetical protein
MADVTCANLRKQRVVCGFSWLLRVTDHEAVLLIPNLFSSLVPRSVVLLKRRSGRQTSSRWLFSRKFDWIVQVIPQHAVVKKGHTWYWRSLLEKWWSGGKSWDATSYYGVRSLRRCTDIQRRAPSSELRGSIFILYTVYIYMTHDVVMPGA